MPRHPVRTITLCACRIAGGVLDLMELGDRRVQRSSHLLIQAAVILTQAVRSSERSSQTSSLLGSCKGRRPTKNIRSRWPGSWPSWVNDTMYFSAILATIGAVFGGWAASRARGPERTIGYIAVAVALGSIGIELKYK